MSTIVIRRNQLGRTPTRGKSYARPLSSGMEISIFPKHGALARNGLRKIAGYQLLRVRAGDRGLRSLHGPAIQFLPAKFLWDLSVPRTVFTSLVQPAKQPSGGFSQSLKPLLSRVLHASKEQHGVIRWKEKAFPNSTKVLAKVK